MPFVSRRPAQPRQPRRFLMLHPLEQFAIIRTRWHTRPLSARAKRRSSAAPGSLRKKYADIVHPPNMVHLTIHSTTSWDHPEARITTRAVASTITRSGCTSSRRCFAAASPPRRPARSPAAIICASSALPSAEACQPVNLQFARSVRRSRISSGRNSWRYIFGDVVGGGDPHALMPENVTQRLVEMFGRVRPADIVRVQ